MKEREPMLNTIYQALTAFHTKVSFERALSAVVMESRGSWSQTRRLSSPYHRVTEAHPYGIEQLMLFCGFDFCI